MIDVRDGLASGAILNTDDVNCIINDICTNQMTFIYFTMFI